MPTGKPSNVYNRDSEWADLIGFVTAPGQRLRLGIMYGRRRFGKSHLLRGLVESVGGLYHLSLQEERRPALDRFANTLSRQIPSRPPIRFNDWTEAIKYAVALLGQMPDGPQVLVLDEYPYLRRASPELDSALQAIIDEASSGTISSDWNSPVTIMVCGSAMSVMTSILSGTAPLRGRAALDMPLASFDFRQARGFWEIHNLETAFAVDAIVGGAAGYKELTWAAGTPQSVDDLEEWLASTVLNPSHALFREDEYLLREDPRITAEAPYYSLLGAISWGSVSQGRIAASVGRGPGDIVHHLKVMTTAGFLVRDEDLLTPRRPRYRIADPIVRFHHLVTRRHREMLERRRPADVWAAARPSYRSQVVGPHFKFLCREWVNRYAAPATLGAAIGPACRVQVNDPDLRQAFEMDIAAPLLSGESSAGRGLTLQVVGKAKASRLDLSDLARVDRLTQLLTSRDKVSPSPTLKRLLFSLKGFTPALVSCAKQRPDVELVDLDRLYHGA